MPLNCVRMRWYHSSTRLKACDCIGMLSIRAAAGIGEASTPTGDPPRDLPHTPELLRVHRPWRPWPQPGHVAGVSRNAREARRWRFFYGDCPLADIFVSYSRHDRPRVAPLVAALEAQGWSVWWDPDITPGEEFDTLISRELDEARSLIVVWTPQSVESRWVRGEARDAADRGVLVPIRFEDRKSVV